MIALAIILVLVFSLLACALARTAAVADRQEDVAFHSEMHAGDEWRWTWSPDVGWQEWPPA